MTAHSSLLPKADLAVAPPVLVAPPSFQLAFGPTSLLIFCLPTESQPDDPNLAGLVGDCHAWAEAAQAVCQFQDRCVAAQAEVTFFEIELAFQNKDLVPNSTCARVQNSILV